MYKQSDFEVGKRYTIKMKDKEYPKLRWLDGGGVMEEREAEVVVGTTYNVEVVEPIVPLPAEHLNEFIYVWNLGKNIHHWMPLSEMESVFDESAQRWV